MPTHVRVTAAKDREVPIALQTASAPGGDLLRVKAGDIVRLPWDSYVRRRVIAGDLVLVNKGGTPVKTPEEAEYNAESFTADDDAANAKAEADRKAATVPPVAPTAKVKE